MTSDATKVAEEPRYVLLDGIENLEVPRDEYFNEVRSLHTLVMGLRQLYATVKRKELAFERADGGKYKVAEYGTVDPAEAEMLDMIACCFHWFGLSICNYARLTGFIRGLHNGVFSRTDLRDASNFYRIKKATDAYVEGVAELEKVRVWRNKVFAHFAATDPCKTDNIATLDMSVIFPVAFTGRYVVGGMTMRRTHGSVSHKSELPQWSITEVFESLEARFWPGMKFQEQETA